MSLTVGTVPAGRDIPGLTKSITCSNICSSTEPAAGGQVILSYYYYALFSHKRSASLASQLDLAGWLARSMARPAAGQAWGGGVS